MADEADFADHLQQQRLDNAIAAVRSKPAPLPPRGQCHHCGEHVEGSALFCDSNCSVDFDRATAAEMRNKGVTYEVACRNLSQALELETA